VHAVAVVKKHVLDVSRQGYIRWKVTDVTVEKNSASLKEY
jgi:hypothetical protein